MKAGRKNLKREALEHGVEEPGEGHVLMRVVGLRGGNIVEAENAAGESTLCLLPAKFQKTIWIKTGTIVIVDEADREKAVESGSKVTGTISRVLLENQVRTLRKSVSWWPELFKDERLVYPDGETLNPKTEEVGEDLEESESDDGLPPLEANSNRQHAMSTYECAESDDSSDDEMSYRAVFGNFDPAIVAKFDEKKELSLIADSSICFPEAEVRGAVDNAALALKIIEEYGSLSKFLWSYVNHKPIISQYKLAKQVPVKTPKSEVLSKATEERFPVRRANHDVFGDASSRNGV